MNNKSDSQHDDDMRSEYDFSHGVRGKHAAAMQRGYKTIIHKRDGTTEVQEHGLPEGAVVLDPDVRAYFPDATAVNSVLRSLIKLIPSQMTSHGTKK